MEGGNPPYNPLELPLYIVSLVEHKTEVKYNVAMQMLWYMIHIWEDYEKEMEKKYPHISARKIARLSKQYSDAEIMEEIMKEFALSKEEAEDAVRRVLGD